jgi:hypothetical protein
MYDASSAEQALETAEVVLPRLEMEKAVIR